MTRDLSESAKRLMKGARYYGQLSDARQVAIAYLKLAEAAAKVRAQSYLDDDVLNRHSHTTTSCEALRELFSAIAESRPSPATRQESERET